MICELLPAPPLPCQVVYGPRVLLERYDAERAVVLRHPAVLEGEHVHVRNVVRVDHADGQPPVSDPPLPRRGHEQVYPARLRPFQPVGHAFQIEAHAVRKEIPQVVLTDYLVDVVLRELVHPALLRPAVHKEAPGLPVKVARLAEHGEPPRHGMLLHEAPHLVVVTVVASVPDTALVAVVEETHYVRRAPSVQRRLVSVQLPVGLRGPSSLTESHAMFSSLSINHPSISK